MTPIRLWVETVPEALTLGDLIWRADGASSFHTNLEPDLSEFGNVAPPNRELVWLAVTSFLADRITKRRKGWHRNLHIVVPVHQITTWQAVGEKVGAMLSFLTSDTWLVEFSGEDAADLQVKSSERPQGDLVCLFSDGADSLCGAIQALDQGYRPVLTSHWDWAGHAGIQSRLARELSQFFDTDLPHVQVRIGRKSRQLDGPSFRDEPSRRSRSLLFLALGLAVASVEPPLPMWIPENGFTSLNPPLAPERRGSLSTRSTHPTFLLHLRQILRDIGAYSNFWNPFDGFTKGEQFASIARRIGNANASRLLSMTHSCSHVRWANSFGRSPTMHCGVCLGCAVRRAAFVKADLDDQTSYLIEDLSNSERSEFLNWSTVPADVETLRYAINRDIGPADVLAMDLPEDHDLVRALDLITRGFDELSNISLPQR